jgi:hypothetical protein
MVKFLLEEINKVNVLFKKQFFNNLHSLISSKSDQFVFVIESNRIRVLQLKSPNTGNRLEEKFMQLKFTKFGTL